MRGFDHRLASRNQIRQRRLAGRTAVLAGLPILILGLAAGAGAAATTPGGQVSTCTGTGIDAPSGITAGPATTEGDQALWFTNQAGGKNGTGSIGEIIPPCQVSNYNDPTIDDPTGITAGPATTHGDQALWFTNTGNNSIGEVEINTTTWTVAVLNFTYSPSGDPGIDEPKGITAGPDGNLWFTNFGNNSIGRITPSGAVTIFPGTITNGVADIDAPEGITAGPDGALWFTNSENDTIGRITTSGTVTSPPYTGNNNPEPWGIDEPSGITAGPEGSGGQALWFTNQAGGQDSTGAGSIMEMTTSGAVLINSSGPSNGSVVNPTGIAVGPDGALWFTNTGNGSGNSIGRITTSDTVYTYSSTSIDDPEGITAGPDGALWFTNNGDGSGNSIGRITPPAPQTITFTSTPPSPAVYGGNYTPVATASSGQSVKFTIDTASTACTINGSGVVSFTAAGTCIIDANQAGNAYWLPAPQVQQSFTVGQAPQTITFTSTPPASPVFGSTYTVSATGGGSGNPVTFGIASEGLGPCVISGSTVTFIGAGSCTITANQAGTADYQAGSADQVITVPQEAPVLTWNPPADIADGEALSSTQLDATANVAGTFTYSPPAGTVLALGTHTLTATFTPANTTNYTSGTVSRQITVIKVTVPPCPQCNK
jgi:streptogramin lyase